MEKINEKQRKLQDLVNEHSERVERTGRSHIDTCDASYYGWDSDIWDHRYKIMDTFRERGYQVTAKTNHGVLDIVIVKQIKLT